MDGRILVVDDEKEIADLVEFYLLGEGFAVEKCYDAKTALARIEEGGFDLALLDVMLPGMSGFDLCRKIREHDNYPVIMLTAKDGELDKVTGLTLGADDYVTKPFFPLELVARVKAQIRRYKRYGTVEGAVEPQAQRANRKAEAGERIYCGVICLVPQAHLCYVNDREVALTPTEYTILKTLCEKKGNVVSGEELFHAVWKDDYYSKSNNTVAVHIWHIREKIGDTAEQSQMIKTVWGVGYKIDG